MLHHPYLNPSSSLYVASYLVNKILSLVISNCICIFALVNYEYDVFLSFAERDLENVEKIYKALENDYNYRVVWHHRDFTIGVPSEQNMEEFIQKSRKVVIILTQAFLESDNCKNEYAIAYSRLADNKENCMVMVSFSPCSTPKEVKFLKQLNFKHSHFMEDLIDTLGE